MRVLLICSDSEAARVAPPEGGLRSALRGYGEVTVSDAAQEGLGKGFLRRAARLIAALPPRQKRLPVLLTGSLPHLARRAQQLAASPLWARTAVILHMSSVALPLHAQVANLLRPADAVVVGSALLEEAVRRCCREAAPPFSPQLHVIPDGIERSFYAPLECTDRVQVRRDRFGLGARDLLLVMVSDRTGRSAAAAMHLFRFFAKGLFGSCKACRCTTPYRFRPERGDFEPVGCRACSRHLEATSRPRRRMRLYVHTPWREAETLWLDGLRRRMALEESVVLNRDLQPTQRTRPRR